MPYSVTKAFTAMAALVLVDRGLLDLDESVQRHWPQLRARATVRQLLSHQVGLVALSEPATPELLLDWDRLCARLSREEPRWRSGTAIGESALFYGHLVGELVRRVDGRPLGRFLREEVCVPHGLDFPSASTTRTWHAPSTSPVSLARDRSARRRRTGRPCCGRRCSTRPAPSTPDVVNSAAFRRAEVPAINGHGTARAVAGLYAALLAGRIISPALRDEAASAQARGVDRVMGGPERAWGLGFGVDDEGFGMGGIGGSVGWASTRDNYAFAFLTGTMGTHDRADAVETAFRDVLGLPPL